jgi:hypothetical protein
MPPDQPFLSTAAAAKEEAIVELAGKLVHAALIHGGPNYHKLRELHHVLGHVWREGERLGHELTKGPDE